MLPRRLEPEVMDTVEDADDYDAMDHATVNRLFVEHLLEFCGASGLSSRLAKDAAVFPILDVGTGTALIPIEFYRQLPPRSKQGSAEFPSGPNITAIDLADEMLKLARRNIDRAGLSHVIHVERIDAKKMPYQSRRFEAVISNSIVHHIPEPRDVLAEMLRVLRAGGVLFIRDLLRPQTVDDVEHIVATYAGNENAHSQQLFRDSLHAALTLSEVRDLARPFGVPADAVRQTSDRHWTLAWTASGGCQSPEFCFPD
jgi:ubiquinone/menaquinone biosynthesis C-methylase UbiE